jgi:putative SOS response-associated peptidase YedK
MRRKPDNVSRELLQQHLRQVHWGLVSSTFTQKQKFDRLQGKKRPTKNMKKENLVKNLTNKSLEPAAVSILGKSLNYAPV